MWWMPLTCVRSQLRVRRTNNTKYPFTIDLITGVLFYSILTEPRLQKVKILLVLTKMDYSYRQMRNEALLMLQMSKLQKQIRQQVTIVEASAVTKVGLSTIYEWLQRP